MMDMKYAIWTPEMGDEDPNSLICGISICVEDDCVVSASCRPRWFSDAQAMVGCSLSDVADDIHDRSGAVIPILPPISNLIDKDALLKLLPKHRS